MVTMLSTMDIFEKREEKLRVFLFAPAPSTLLLLSRFLPSSPFNPRPELSSMSLYLLSCALVHTYRQLQFLKSPLKFTNLCLHNLSLNALNMHLLSHNCCRVSACNGPLARIAGDLKAKLFPKPLVISR